jgi:hypothetical protein
MVCWIGFDMDDCIGHVIPLYRFVMHLPEIMECDPVLVHIRMAELLYKSETHGYTWIFRPSFRGMLPLLYKTQHEGRIAGAFVYSNNESPELVDFVVLCMNVFAQLAHGLDAPVALFRLGVSQESPCRAGGGLVKSYEGIQASLKYARLPTCDKPSDLLFFDDSPHVLMGEGAYYCKVAPYTYITPPLHLLTLFETLVDPPSHPLWAAIVQKNLDSKKLASGPPLPSFSGPDTTLVFSALRQFLSPSK